MKSKYALIFFFGLLIATAHGQGVESDDIKNKIRPAFELYTYRISADTLSLVFNGKFLYYPFGQINSLKDLRSKYPNLYKNKGGENYLVKENSYVKFFYDPDHKAFEIVYAKIADPIFEFTNGIRTGMTKKELFDVYFSSPPNSMDRIKILQLEHAIVGIWHYYRFEDNILTSLVLDTDYQIDKN
jgi:hypothetical protein